MSDDRPRGFQFPGRFEIAAMGAADAGLERIVPEALTGAGLNVIPGSVRVRGSAGGRYVSVRVEFDAETRDHYEAAHHALRARPEVKWTL
ncbi:MAG TPA: hypothetical protein DDZ76_12980 [Xanthomonadales bacterium]|nr:hypothetical protein [Xanthomonadales bacterium]